LQAFSEGELDMILQMIKRGLNSPVTSSVGRLFDAVASIVGLGQHINFEGQIAMALEYALDEIQTKEYYRFKILDDSKDDSVFVIDWQQMIKEIIDDVRSRVNVGEISAKFHNTLIESAVEVVRRVGEKKVVLSGGCFQNKYLTEGIIERLEQEGFIPYWHQRVPPNDGGISLGQVVVLANRVQK
ncbi:MAG: carbamoyltransferase HypF, partial [Bacteroidota bacterium]|nr:carbamoyltransferase HypF [Bacteroidota bacterium]